MHWIPTTSTPSEQDCPKDSGNMDYCSVEVLVAYRKMDNDWRGRIYYAIGWTDWDGECSWIVRGVNEPIEILAYSYIEPFKP